MIPSADINWDKSPVAYRRRNINTEEFSKKRPLYWSQHCYSPALAH